MKRYFTADTHFGNSTRMIRGMLRRYPGSNIHLFPSTEAHDNHLLDAINSVVKTDDELYVLGDFAAKKPGKYRARINCRHVYLIRGNHDPVQASLNVFGEMPYQRTVRLRHDAGTLWCVLSHCPQAYWFGSHRGWAHLYGHTHGQREDCLDLAFGNFRRSFDVGVDNIREIRGDYCPLPEDALYTFFSRRQGHDNQLFYQDFQDARDRKLGFDPQERPRQQR